MSANERAPVDAPVYHTCDRATHEQNRNHTHRPLVAIRLNAGLSPAHVLRDRSLLHLLNSSHLPALCPCRQHLDRPEPAAGPRPSLWLENHQRLHGNVLLARSHRRHPVATSPSYRDTAAARCPGEKKQTCSSKPAQIDPVTSGFSSSVVSQQEEAGQQSSNKETEGPPEDR